MLRWHQSSTARVNLLVAIVAALACNTVAITNVTLVPHTARGGKGGEDCSYCLCHCSFFESSTHIVIV